MDNEPNKNVKEPTPTPGADGGETTVTISQEKLDSLINEKFKKGAEKANATLLESLGVESIDSLKEIMKAKHDADDAQKTELEKANETITTLNNTMADLTDKLSKADASKKMDALAIANGIKEVDYFKYEYNKASKEEGFNEAVFIDTLLKTKGGLLTGDASTTIVNPKNINNDQNLSKISMAAYSMLGSSERAKYKPSQITKD